MILGSLLSLWLYLGCLGNIGLLHDPPLNRSFVPWPTLLSSHFGATPLLVLFFIIGVFKLHSTHRSDSDFIWSWFRVHLIQSSPKCFSFYHMLKPFERWYSNEDMLAWCKYITLSLKYLPLDEFLFSKMKYVMQNWFNHLNCLCMAIEVWFVWPVYLVVIMTRCKGHNSCFLLLLHIFANWYTEIHSSPWNRLLLNWIKWWHNSKFWKWRKRTTEGNKYIEHEVMQWNQAKTEVMFCFEIYVRR